MFFKHVLDEIHPRSPRSGEKIHPENSSKTATEGGEKIHPRFSGFSAKIAAEGGRNLQVPYTFVSKNRRRKRRKIHPRFSSKIAAEGAEKFIQKRG